MNLGKWAYGAFLLGGSLGYFYFHPFPYAGELARALCLGAFLGLLAAGMGRKTLSWLGLEADPREKLLLGSALGLGGLSQILLAAGILRQLRLEILGPL